MNNRKEARAWDDAFDREFFTPEEISESDMRANIITAMIEARDIMSGKMDARRYSSAVIYKGSVFCFEVRIMITICI